MRVINKWLICCMAGALVCMLSACKKDTIELLTQEVESNTTYTLQDVVFVNDSTGYACGGDRWTRGVLISTNNGGQTWSQPDSLYDQCAYSCFFRSAAEGYVAGNSSYLAYTRDSAQTFSFSVTNYRLISDIVFIGGRAVKVGGEGYAKGYIAYSSDNGANWQQTDYAGAMNAISVADNNTVFVCGYGTIYRSTDGGENFSPLDVRGDNFVSCHFPSPKVGYFAGYERKILKTIDGGNSFKTVMKGNAPFSHRENLRAIKFWDESTGYAIGDNGIMYKTISGGDGWQQVKQFTEANLRAIHLFSSSSGIVVGDNGKIFLFQ